MSDRPVVNPERFLSNAGFAAAAQSGRARFYTGKYADLEFFFVSLEIYQTQYATKVRCQGCVNLPCVTRCGITEPRNTTFAEPCT